MHVVQGRPVAIKMLHQSVTSALIAGQRETEGSHGLEDMHAAALHLDQAAHVGNNQNIARSAMSDLIREATFLASLKHQNIVQLYGANLEVREEA